MSIYDVEKLLDIVVPDGDFDTLSGYLVEELGRIPQEKEKILIETPEVNYKVESVKDKRIVRVKACKNNIEEDEDEEEEEEKE